MGSFLGRIEPRALTMTAKQVGTTFECPRSQVWQDLRKFKSELGYIILLTREGMWRGTGYPRRLDVKIQRDAKYE